MSHSQNRLTYSLVCLLSRHQINFSVRYRAVEMRISVVGLGKLGAPLVAVLASKGFEVVGVDRVPTAVSELRAGRAPVMEPGLQDLLAGSLGRIDATTDIQFAIATSEITFVVLPTPTDNDGRFSTAHVISAIREIGAALRSKTTYHLVVITSTVMPGSTGGPIRQALEISSGRHLGSDLGLCYNPEFIALGSVISDMLRPDLVLIGESDAHAGDLLASIYERVCDNRPYIHRMNFVNAEITKMSVNTFVTGKISFANMVSDICDRLPGADASTVLSAIGCDARIGNKYLSPALGYGGPCFPRDNAAFASMARAIGAQADFAEAADSINRRQPARVVNLVRSLLPRGTIGVLGLSYKPATALIEESQGLAIASQLAAVGYRVIAFDPQAGDAATSVLRGEVQIMEQAQTCVEMADLLIIATPWPAFKDIPQEAFRRPNGPMFVIDCWRMLPFANFADVINLIYLGKYRTHRSEASVQLARRRSKTFVRDLRSCPTKLSSTNL
jgi:UDPglucose 6-dehydrogenase